MLAQCTRAERERGGGVSVWDSEREKRRPQNFSQTDNSWHKSGNAAFTSSFAAGGC